MIATGRITAALVLSVFVLSGVSCRSAGTRDAARSCGNDALTSYPALLVLAPHPDDEVLGFAGLIDAYLRAGKPVRVVVSTDGDAYCEACRFWKNSSVTGPMCSAAELSNFSTPEIDSLAEVRREESTAAALILGFSPPVFLGYPDTGLAAAWRNLNEGRAAEPLLRSDFSGCSSCETCGYGAGPRTTLTAETLTETLRSLLAEQPAGSLVATTHWLDGHPDHAALGNLVRRLAGEVASPHAVAYSVIHAKTKNTADADCWYPAPRAPDCPCMNDEARALADPQWIARAAAGRLRPSLPASLPADANYGTPAQLCLPERLYAGEGALKLQAVRAYASQIGHLARSGSHPVALEGILDCNGYLTAFVRRTEVFVVVEPR